MTTEVYYDESEKDYVLDEDMSHGYYFAAFNHDYVLEIVELKKDANCVINIYSGDCLQNGRTLDNFHPVKFNKYLFSHEYTMNIWPKYYFIKYEEKHPEGYQMYHDNNEIDAQQAVLKAALAFGIEKAKITLY